MNTLACRLDVNTVIHGQMCLNGAPYDNAELKRMAGYVMQDDLLNGHLTVYETLMYTAELRLPRQLTQQERQKRVHDVLLAMGISHVKNVIVGTVMKKGISGGERKRLCVGMQLLNRPQLLFLDEPTSGLDSVTALDLLHTFHAFPGQAVRSVYGQQSDRLSGRSITDRNNTVRAVKYPYFHGIRPSVYSPTKRKSRIP